MRVLELHHASVIVADVASALAFYRDLLGLAETARPDLGYPGAWLVAGGRQIHLLQVPAPPPGERPVHVGRDRHVAFYVDDVDAFAARLAAEAVAFTRSRSGRRALFCRDPDGNGIELIEADPQASRAQAGSEEED